MNICRINSNGSMSPLHVSDDARLLRHPKLRNLDPGQIRGGPDAAPSRQSRDCGRLVFLRRNPAFRGARPRTSSGTARASGSAHRPGMSREARREPEWRPLGSAPAPDGAAFPHAHPGTVVPLAPCCSGKLTHSPALMSALDYILYGGIRITDHRKSTLFGFGTWPGPALGPHGPQQRRLAHITAASYAERMTIRFQSPEMRGPG